MLSDDTASSLDGLSGSGAANVNVLAMVLPPSISEIFIVWIAVFSFAIFVDLWHAK